MELKCRFSNVLCHELIPVNDHVGVHVCGVIPHGVSSSPEAIQAVIDWVIKGPVGIKNYPGGTLIRSAK